MSRRNPTVPRGGWFTNEARNRRRWAPKTLTDKDVWRVVDAIAGAESYSSMPPPLDRLLRSRDEALIALPWLWPKRALEVLSLRLGDVSADGKELAVTFRIEKRSKRYKECPSCKKRGTKERLFKNATYANFCKACGSDISKVDPVVFKPAPAVVVKRKTLRYPFCRPVVSWIGLYRAHLESLPSRRRPQALEDAYLFPRFHPPSLQVVPGEHITNERFDQILQRVDVSLSSHIFRYGKTETLYRLGYSTPQVKQAGDWNTERMPSIYAERKGLTPEAKQYAEDVRVEE